VSANKIIHARAPSPPNTIRDTMRMASSNILRTLAGSSRRVARSAENVLAKFSREFDTASHEAVR
jgi:hypothetical protein